MSQITLEGSLSSIWIYIIMLTMDDGNPMSVPSAYLSITSTVLTMPSTETVVSKNIYSELKDLNIKYIKSHVRATADARISLPSHPIFLVAVEPFVVFFCHSKKVIICKGQEMSRA
jgi:hypothetical protein